MNMHQAKLSPLILLLSVIACTFSPQESELHFFASYQDMSIAKGDNGKSFAQSNVSGRIEGEAGSAARGDGICLRRKKGKMVYSCGSEMSIHRIG